MEKCYYCGEPAPPTLINNLPVCLGCQDDDNPIGFEEEQDYIDFWVNNTCEPPGY